MHPQLLLPPLLRPLPLLLPLPLPGCNEPCAQALSPCTHATNLWVNSSGAQPLQLQLGLLLQLIHLLVLALLALLSPCHFGALLALLVNCCYARAGVGMLRLRTLPSCHACHA